MRLLLRIHNTTNPANSIFLTQIFELFHPQYLTPAVTGNSSGDVRVSVQLEIDGDKELTQEQWAFLKTYRHTLSFVEPPRRYTEEEAAELEAIDEASRQVE